MDLHQIDKNKFYLHFIDVISRYSRAVFICDKKPETIISRCIDDWISIFGVPLKTLTDNGGEFDNQRFVSLAENYGIILQNTAAESPWSNAICERLNATPTELFLKLRAEYSHTFSDETILKYCCGSKNSLLSKDGFSPCKIVLGRNPRLPEPPALENYTTSESVQKRLLLFHESRKAYIQAECSDRLKRALQSKIVPQPVW